MSATEKKPTPGKQEPLRHVHIHPECSLCGCYFDVGDRLFACELIYSFSKLFINKI